MESPYYEMTHDFEEENRLFQSGYAKGYHDAVMKCPDIVRCRDCNKRGQAVYRADDTEYIVCWHQELGIQKHPIDWYCADGERRETDA